MSSNGIFKIFTRLASDQDTPRGNITRNRVVQLSCLAAVVACLLAASLLVEPINAERAVTQVGVPTERADIPPDVQLATAMLGAFRGVLVDMLWYRANKFKEEGKYYEANSLADVITTLQPHMPQVWAFMSWDMAYNISVETNTLQERWDWVNKGIVLLRDKGIPYNPRSIRLYRELQWIFFHKIGQYSDDAHWYYKSQLASEWQEILGAPNESASSQDAIDAFAPIANAPQSLAQVIHDHPDVQPLVDELKKIGLEPDEAALRQIGRIAMLNYSPDAKLLGYKITNVTGFTPGLPDLLQNPKYAPAFEPLLAYMRKKVLENHYHMDVQEMLTLLKEDGPLDWRHPAAQGHYWSDMGTKLANELIDPTSADLINTYRGRLHSIQDLMRGGRLVYDPVSGHIDLLPDPRFVEVYEHVLEIAKAEVVRTGQRVQINDTYDAGEENFLLQATCFAYLYGDIDKAQEYFERIKKKFGDSPQNIRADRYKGTLEDLVTRELQNDVFDMQSNARQFIDAMIGRAIRQGLYNGDRNIFNRFVTLAKDFHDKFQKKSIATPITTEQDRLALLPFDQIIDDTYISIMRSNQYRALDLARIWTNTPPQIKLDTYDKLVMVFQKQTQQAGLNPDLAFPAPEGWKPPAPAETKPPANTPPAVHVERH